MAEDSGQERTLEPSEKKLNEAREKGNFPRSKEISTVSVFLAALLFLWLGEEYFILHILNMGKAFLRFDQFLNLNETNMPNLFFLAVQHIAMLLLPLLGLVFAAGVASELGQIGIRVLKDPFEPKWDRLNPVEGLKRIFSLKQYVEGLKSLLKICIFSIMAWTTVSKALPQMVSLPGATPMQGLQLMLDIGLRLGFRTCIVLLFFSGADYTFQRWQYYKQLRMTHQEQKEEAREQQGDPILKQRMRSIQMEIARKRMMHDVPKSDVVITNPTHYAVALRYDPENDAAPIVVAKGQNFIAFKIREIAEKSGIPIVENPPVARALYKEVKIGQAVPPALFKAVAQILASIWKLAALRGRTWTGTRRTT
ncbi:TPA: flagellar biosynthesis protein FlhB [Candidatus Sumerlaeota bacterium]|jgi:flagellar biosynthesis protein FlhB|nr:flagellar biosynthesis protein FlhB [Candidatus Sumerlaeota bacterium]